MSEQGLETSKPSVIVASHMGKGELEKVIRLCRRTCNRCFPRSLRQFDASRLAA
jgi:hypothetical protein